MIVYLDGRFVPAAEAHISIEDRGYLLGDGVFETALLHDGGFLRLRQHLDRFRGSAGTLRIEAPGGDEIDAIVREVLRRNEMNNASIRLTLTRGTDHPVLLVTARPLDPDWTRRAAGGWSVVTARTRRPSTAAVPAQLKALGRTYALLARLEATDAGADDALLLTDEGFVCEGPTWNVFWRTGHVLFTPALEAGVLAGVTRSILLELGAQSGLDVVEGMFGRSALDDADEIFASMTSVGIATFRSLDGRTLPSVDTARRLQTLYEARVAEETAADPL